MTTYIHRQERRAGERVFLELTLSSDSGVNPLASSTVLALRDALAELSRPGAAHGLVLSANGRAFSAGADIKEFRLFDETAFRTYMSDILGLYAEMLECPRPIVSIVAADALGGGAALAFCSDFVLAREGVRFSLPEALRGLAGAGWLMPRLVGRQRASEMVMLGRSYDARQMQSWGLVNEVCAEDELASRAQALCEELARLPETTFAVAKPGLAAGLGRPLREAMDTHIAVQTAAFIEMRRGTREAASPVEPH